MDLISVLPDNLIESILLKVPLRDAARTCILSARWRYCWVKLPKLVLDSEFWKQLIPKEEGQVGGKIKFARIISQVLLLHQGSITDFRLEIPENTSSPEIDSFIGFIVRQGLKWFFVRMGLDEDYQLPSSLFNCPSLVELNLWGCKINLLPSTFRGFSLLTCLILADVIISVEALQSVISDSPLLENLQLRIAIDILDIVFVAPNLVTFLYHHSLITRDNLLPVHNGPKQTICDLFYSLSNIDILYLDTHSLKCLATGGVPMILPTPLLHLESIVLGKVRLEVEGMFSCILCLIRSSPILQDFQISVDQSEGVTEDLQGFEDNSHLECNCLTEVTVKNIVGTRTEMELIKLFLAKSPALKKLSIKLATDKADKIVKIMNGLFQFQQASSNVKINIID